jgi:nitric oxide reductase subunit B
VTFLSGGVCSFRNGLMEYGSIFGHGAYLGPDFTADCLHRAALSVTEFYGGASSDRAKVQTIGDFKANRYDPAVDTLTYTPAQIQFGVVMICTSPLDLLAPASRCRIAWRRHH